MNRFKQPLNWLTLASIFMVTITISLAGCGDDPKPPTVDPVAGGPILYVANDNQGAGNLSAILLETGELIPNVAGLGNVPNDIVFAGNKMFVINSNSQQLNVFAFTDSVRLTPIDTVDISFGGNRSPAYGAIASTGDLYITNFVDNSISVVDTSSMTIELIIPLGAAGRSPQDILAKGDKIYVAMSGLHQDDYSYDTTSVVAVISTVSNRIVGQIPVGCNPQYLKLDGEGQLHVVCTGNYSTIQGEVYRINTFADTLNQVIHVGGYPGDIAITGQFGYICYYVDENVSHVYRYNSVTGQILNGRNNPIIVAAGAGRLTSADDGSIFVSCFASDKVEKIVAGARTDSWSAGDGPGAMMIVNR